MNAKEPTTHVVSESASSPGPGQRLSEAREAERFRVFTGIDRAGGQFQETAADGVAVLADEEHVAPGIDGQQRDAAVVDHDVVRCLAAAGIAKAVDAQAEPAIMRGLA